MEDDESLTLEAARRRAAERKKLSAATGETANPPVSIAREESSAEHTTTLSEKETGIAIEIHREDPGDKIPNEVEVESPPALRNDVPQSGGEEPDLPELSLQEARRRAESRKAAKEPPFFPSAQSPTRPRVLPPLQRLRTETPADNLQSDKDASAESAHSDQGESPSLPAHRPAAVSDRETDGSEYGIQLSVRMLKERLELEVGLRREGLRWMFFSLLCVCYMIAFYTATAPHDRGEARWYISQTAELDRLMEVSNPKSLYDAIMRVTQGVRDMTPLSSEFVEDPLYKMMVGTAQKFPSGPVEVPSDRRPQLQLEWTMTFRMRLDNPFEAIPRRRLIVRQYMAGDTTGGSCWAIYNQGYNKYILEYGSNTMAGRALPKAIYQPPKWEITTNPRGLNFVALRINTTHVNFVMEGASSISQPLVSGTLPTTCAGGNIEVGDMGLTLHLLQYHPVYLTDTELIEYELSEYTVEDVASGTTRFSKDDISKQAQASKVDVETQRMINRYGSSGLSISRFSGSLAYMASESANSSAKSQQNFMPGADAPVGSPLQVNPSTGKLHWKQNQVQEGSLEYWPVIASQDEVPDLGYFAERKAPSLEDEANSFYGVDVEPIPSSEINDAFQSLYGASIYDSWDFTLSWWAKADSAPGVVELNMFSLETNKSKFMIYNGELDFESGAVDAWFISFNDAPHCEFSNNTRCIKSPAAVCQRPAISGYDGIWRHYALRFEYSVDFSQIGLFLDGRSICSIRFESDIDLIPHYFADNSTIAAFGQRVPDRNKPGLKAKLSVKDMRLYHSSLNSSAIKLIAQNPEIKECLDVEFNSDSSVWVSTFGQTCAEISTLSKDGVDGAPGACMVPEVQANCPVSCQHMLSPRCFDGVPPSNKEINSRIMHVEYLAKIRDSTESKAFPPEFAYLNNQASLQLQLLAADWAGDQADADFSSTHDGIRKMKDGSLIATVTTQKRLDGLLAANQGLWVQYSEEGEGTPSCNGQYLDEALDEAGAAPGEPRLIQQICETEMKSLEALTRLRDVTAVGRDIWEATGWKYSNFDIGMLGLGASSTLYFWARIANPQDMRLTGVDLDNNICFSFQSSGAWLQQHNVVSAYETHLQSGFDILDFNPRFRIAMPESAHDAFNTRDTWVFFALSIDQQAKIIRYAVNGFVNEVSMPKNLDFGCNSLHAIYNSGTDVQLSPLKISKFPLVSGSMQQLYLMSREAFGDATNGEENTREDRLELTVRPVEPYTAKVFGIMPPLLLQSRKGSPAGSQKDANCKDGVSNKLNARLGTLMERKCLAPYLCENLTQAVECELDVEDSEVREPAKQLFGMPRMRIPPFGDVYPDFPWGLHDDMIVRNGEIIKPPLDYINGNTLAITLLLCFYAPSSRVATLVVSTFDMGKVKVSISSELLQVNVLRFTEFKVVLAWSVVGVVSAIVGIILAWPAATEEFKEMMSLPMEWWAKYRQYLREKRKKKRGYVMRATSFIQSDSSETKREYSEDTTQPDAVDVLLNLAMIALIIMFGWNTYQNYLHTDEVFSTIASIQWGSNDSVDEKVREFVAPLQRAFELVQTDELYGLLTFWILMLCCLRMIVYMKMHPKTASIAQTFGHIGMQLVNFMFTFLVVYTFLAYIAHVRFGYKYNEFSTLRQTFVTQFALLIGDSAPDYSLDSMMCIYVVIFVAMCSLSLLNFLLAIVVDGYSAVTEESIEKKVAKGFVGDVLSVPVDILLWRRHKHWPNKIQMLKLLQDAYTQPFVSEDIEDAVNFGITEVKFKHAMMGKSAHGNEILDQELSALFDHYACMEALHVKRSSKWNDLSSLLKSNRSRLE